MTQLYLPLAAAGLTVFILLLWLGRPLVWLVKLALRTGGSLLGLGLLQGLGLTLGVNWFNALALGLLGLPGLALLLLLQWFLPQLC